MITLILFFISFVFLLFVARWLYNGLFGPAGALAASGGAVKLAIAIVAIFGSAAMAAAVAYFATDLLKGSEGNTFGLVESLVSGSVEGTFNIFDVPGPLIAGSLIGLAVIIFMVVMVWVFLFGPAKETASGRGSAMLAFVALFATFLLVVSLLWGVTEILSGPDGDLLTWFKTDVTDPILNGSANWLIFTLPESNGGAPPPPPGPYPNP